MMTKQSSVKSAVAGLAMAALSLGATQAKAEEVVVERDDVTAPNMLLVNPGDLLGGIISVEYERALNSAVGLTLGVSVSSFQGAFTPASQAGLLSVGPELGLRLHFIQDAPAGLWIGPYLGGAYVSSRSGAAVSRSFSYGLGAAAGYNFVIGKTFTLQVGAGGGFNDYGSGIAWAPRLRLGLGAVF